MKHILYTPTIQKTLIWRGQKISELILYIALWTILFAAAAFSVYWDGQHPTPEEIAHGVVKAHTYDLMGLLSTWRLLAMFCITFFIHNFFVAPMLVYRNQRWLYGISALLLMAVFVFVIMKRSHFDPRPLENPMEQYGPKQEMMQPPPKADYMPKHDEPNLMKAKPFGGPTTVAFNIMLLLLALNVGTKHYFKSIDDSKRMKDLERDNLNQQLQYLKYQINPHFFMNTLNNIHALVDIDQEEAKRMIETLSKLMRYVLYEADKPMASLKDELNFLNHYISLMKIRYGDEVRINLSMPTSIHDTQVPSLLFATFVENAFKHGVSCRKKSFIEIGASIDERLENFLFYCNNSKQPTTEEQQLPTTKASSGKKNGGVGLQNAIRRLKLVYGDKYELKIEDGEEVYRLMLKIPFKKL